MALVHIHVSTSPMLESNRRSSCPVSAANRRNTAKYVTDKTVVHAHGRAREGSSKASILLAPSPGHSGQQTHTQKRSCVGIYAAEFQKLACKERFPLCNNRPVPHHT